MECQAPRVWVSVPYAYHSQEHLLESQTTLAPFFQASSPSPLPMFSRPPRPTAPARTMLTTPSGQSSPPLCGTLEELTRTPSSTYRQHQHRCGRFLLPICEYSGRYLRRWFECNRSVCAGTLGFDGHLRRLGPLGRSLWVDW